MRYFERSLRKHIVKSDLYSEKFKNDARPDLLQPKRTQQNTIKVSHLKIISRKEYRL